MILIYAPHPDFLPEDGWGRTGRGEVSEISGYVKRRF